MLYLAPRATRAPRFPVAEARSAGEGFRPSEALLAAIWQRQWLDGGPLVDSVGRQVRVVYPGRRWGGAGPDFQGAVLSLGDGSLLRGDVEVHLRAGDWRGHGHDRDPAYNRTALHVVLRRSLGQPAARQDGSTVPLLELSGHLAAPLPELAGRLLEAPAKSIDEACLESAEELIQVVDRAALERFFEKSARFEAELAVREPAEALYRGTLVALGYSANKQACARLAEAVPWEWVRCLGRAADGEQRVRALLLGAAGLLPRQRGLPAEVGEPRTLEVIWSELQDRLDLRPLGVRWRLAGVRPANAPVRRLVGGAALFAAWAREAPQSAQLGEILARRARPAQLFELFRARSSAEFWSRHDDFDVSIGGRPRLWQIGRPRAVEIVVNVLLPLGFAVGKTGGDDELAAAALLAYRGLPAGPWNRISRAMAAQLFGPEGARLCRPAARQQGLLQLFQRWCWERRCERCPAGERRRRLARQSEIGAPRSSLPPNEGRKRNGADSQTVTNARKSRYEVCHDRGGEGRE